MTGAIKALVCRKSLRRTASKVQNRLSRTGLWYLILIKATYSVITAHHRACYFKLKFTLQSGNSYSICLKYLADFSHTMTQTLLISCLYIGIFVFAQRLLTNWVAKLAESKQVSFKRTKLVTQYITYFTKPTFRERMLSVVAICLTTVGATLIAQAIFKKLKAYTPLNCKRLKPT